MNIEAGALAIRKVDDAHVGSSPTSLSVRLAARDA